MTREEAEKRIQELLAEAQSVLSVVKDVAMEHGIEGFQFNGQTFHLTRERWSRRGHLVSPGWYDDEYWQSSTADCSLLVDFGDEEDW